MFETQSSYKLQMECPHGRLGKKFPETRYCEIKTGQKTWNFRKGRAINLRKTAFNIGHKLK